MIVAIASIKDEASIITNTVSHLLGEGVDKVILSIGPSTDDTEAVVKALPDTVDYLAQDGPFDQAAEMTRLAYLAAEDGASWIIPFDADEFWYGDDGRPISTILGELAPEVIKVHAPVYIHLDYSTRVTVPKTWGKVAFRPADPMSLTWGNHTVTNGLGDAVHGILAIRELQYRDYAHFRAKVTKAADLFASWDVPPEHGSHMRALVNLDGEGLAAAYAAWCDVDTTVDLIPYKGGQWT